MCGKILYFTFNSDVFSIVLKKFFFDIDKISLFNA